MTKREELLACLREPKSDPEGAHSLAEDLLISYLLESGDTELAKAWELAQKTQHWWYA